MLILIENGEVYAPEPRGRCSVLLVGDRVGMVGEVDRRAAAALGLDLEVVDAAGCVVTPGFIDPHEHISGGSGEKGFASRTPEIYAREIITAGITTVVGCLGVDTTTKTMPDLLAKAKGLKEEGLSAFVWTGGYGLPPRTLTGSVRDDILFVEEVVGAGEVAVADERSSAPLPEELARVAREAYVGGMLAGKAGLTHVHVGEGRERLSLLRAAVEEYGTPPGCLYPTHVERGEALLEEAIALARAGCFIDIDTVEEDLHRWLGFYLEKGGDAARLTVSSDASISSPRTLFEQVCGCVRRHGFALEQVLPLVTSNPARALKLEGKGALAPGRAADLLVLQAGSLELREVIAGGRRLVTGGEPAFAEKALEESNRSVALRGGKAGGEAPDPAS